MPRLAPLPESSSLELRLDLTKVPRRPDSASSLCSFASELRLVHQPSSRPGTASSSASASTASSSAAASSRPASAASSHMTFSDEMRLVSLGERSARRREEKMSRELRRRAAARLARQEVPAASSLAAPKPVPVSKGRPLRAGPPPPQQSPQSPLQLQGKKMKRVRTARASEEHVARQRTAREALLESARPSSRSRPLSRSSSVPSVAASQPAPAPAPVPVPAAQAPTTEARPMTAPEFDARLAAIRHNATLARTGGPRERRRLRRQQRPEHVVPMHGYTGTVPPPKQSPGNTSRLEATMDELSFNLSGGVHQRFDPYRPLPRGGHSRHVHTPKANPDVERKHRRGVVADDLGYSNFSNFLAECIRLHVDMAKTSH